jgi:Holliday junction resolvasome RuvABC endonuclease subunit
VNTLALDLATTTGFAFLTYKPDTKPSLIEYGHLLFPLKKNCVHEGERYLSVISAYSDLIQRRPVDLIVFENVIRHSSSQAGHLFGYYKHLMLALAAAEKIPVLGYVPTRWKKLACGRGFADKVEVAGVASKMFPMTDWKTDDESDAACIGLAHWYSIR